MRRILAIALWLPVLAFGQTTNYWIGTNNATSSVGANWSTGSSPTNANYSQVIVFDGTTGSNTACSVNNTLYGNTVWFANGYTSTVTLSSSPNCSNIVIDSGVVLNGGFTLYHQTTNSLRASTPFRWIGTGRIDSYAPATVKTADVSSVFANLSGPVTGTPRIRHQSGTLTYLVNNVTNGTTAHIYLDLLFATTAGYVFDSCLLTNVFDGWLVSAGNNYVTLNNSQITGTHYIDNGGNTTIALTNSTLSTQEGTMPVAATTTIYMTNSTVLISINNVGNWWASNMVLSADSQAVIVKCGSGFAKPLNLTMPGAIIVVSNVNGSAASNDRFSMGRAWSANSVTVLGTNDPFFCSSVTATIGNLTVAPNATWYGTNGTIVISGTALNSGTWSNIAETVVSRGATLSNISPVNLSFDTGGTTNTILTSATVKRQFVSAGTASNRIVVLVEGVLNIQSNAQSYVAFTDVSGSVSNKPVTGYSVWSSNSATGIRDMRRTAMGGL